MAELLIIEDQAQMVRAVRDRLVRAGHVVDACADGEAGLQAATTGRYACIILDVALPKLDGFEVCRQLREREVITPILMLTAAAQVADRVHGLGLGADDYLTKPFDMAELVARVGALLRRAAVRAAATPPERAGNLEFDFARATVRRDGEKLDLSDLELRVLQYLVERSGRVVTREELLSNVWQYTGMPATRTVDVRIAALRQRVEENPAEPKRIVTVHGLGYRFIPN